MFIDGWSLDFCQGFLSYKLIHKACCGICVALYSGAVWEIYTGYIFDVSFKRLLQFSKFNVVKKFCYFKISQQHRFFQKDKTTKNSHIFHIVTPSSRKNKHIHCLYFTDGTYGCWPYCMAFFRCVHTSSEHVLLGWFVVQYTLGEINRETYHTTMV